MKLREIKIGKLNVLDLGIILIIILFIGMFTISKIANSSEGKTNETNVSVSNSFTYTFLIENLSNTSKDMFKVGDEVYDKVSNVYIGKIKSLKQTEAKNLLNKANGEIIEAVMPGKIDVELEIETNGTVRAGEYLANDLIRIMVGNQKPIKTKYIMCTGTVTDIER